MNTTSLDDNICMHVPTDGTEKNEVNYRCLLSLHGAYVPIVLLVCMLHGVSTH